MRGAPLFLVLAGCPYIFGEPDLANVDGQPVDTDVAPDTDVDTETDTEPPTIPGDTPQVTSADVEVVYVDHLALAFSVVDADVDLLGGTVRLLDGTNELQSWDIPDDLPDWDPAGVNWLDHYVPIPCTGYSPDLRLVVEDLAGHASEPFLVPFSVAPVAAPSGSTTVVALAVPSLPATWCSTANLVNAAPPVEDDYFTFSNPVDGELLISLDWDPALLVDIDLVLYTAPGPPNGFVADSRDIGFAGHEQLRSKTLDVQGVEVGVQVETWGFSAMSPVPSGPWPYQVIVQEVP